MKTKNPADSTGRRISAAVLAAAGTVLVMIAYLVSIVEAAAFDPSYYVREYEKNGTAQYVGVDQDTLTEATDVLLEYLRGTRQSLDLQVEVSGTVREYYSDREKMHMVDVRDLNLGALAMMWTGYIAGGAALACAFVLSRQKRRVWRTIFWSVLGVLGAFALLGIWAAADFGNLWTSFHHVFFRNDLWLLDPRTSLMIRMFEEQFFFDLVAQILAWYLAGAAAILIVSWLMDRRGKRRSAVT